MIHGPHLTSHTEWCIGYNVSMMEKFNEQLRTFSARILWASLWIKYFLCCSGRLGTTVSTLLICARSVAIIKCKDVGFWILCKEEEFFDLILQMALSGEGRKWARKWMGKIFNMCFSVCFLQFDLLCMFNLGRLDKLWTAS